MKSIFFKLILSTLLLSQVTMAQEKASAVVISGGISLGVYEAGLNHVLVEVMNSKEPEISLPTLKVTTGSSAGAINSVASALRTCTVPENGKEQQGNKPK